MGHTLGSPKWFASSAAGDYARSAFEIATIFVDGYMVTTTRADRTLTIHFALDHRIERYWHKYSADRGNPRPWLYYNEDPRIINKEAESFEGQKKTISWLVKTADLRNMDAAIALAYQYAGTARSGSEE